MSRGIVRVRLVGSAGAADSLIASKQEDEREQTHPLMFARVRCCSILCYSAHMVCFELLMNWHHDVSLTKLI